MQRDNEWLKKRLEQVWQRYFPDRPPLNHVSVKFGRAARTRLGSLKLGRKTFADDTKDSIITITGFFQDPQIPQFVVDGVLAHEVTHYSHGFNSPHPRLYRHPHKGGVVHREMRARGLADTLYLSRKWLKLHWREYVRG